MRRASLSLETARIILVDFQGLSGRSGAAEQMSQPSGRHQFLLRNELEGNIGQN
jgi:hypothetical protein